MADTIRILFLGDVVGEPGRTALSKHLSDIKAKEGIDFAIVNGENSAAGKGITPKIAIELFRAGATVITMGDHVWDQQDVVEYFPTEPRLLRPGNYPNRTPGAGSVILDTPKGKVAVMQAQGRTFMNPPLENPFLWVESELERIKAAGAKVIFLDFHAEATSEKIAMGRMLDGKVSAVVGTHTHVQTADDCILPGGTAYLTDAGMCGPNDSILGRDIASVVWRFKSGLPTRFPIAKGAVRLCGCIVDVNPEDGKAVAFQRYNRLISLTE